jgi:hypothetical protein
MPDTRRPRSGEFDDFYRGYIDKVPDGEIVTILASQLDDTLALMGGVSEERACHRYEPGKWSIKEVVGHVLDTERVFAYRALAFARSDPAPLPDMDQERWVSSAHFGRRTLAQLLGELSLLRASNAAMFSGFSDHDLSLRGRASGREFTVRAVLYIIAGHELHHREVLAERYLG